MDIYRRLHEDHLKMKALLREIATTHPHATSLRLVLLQQLKWMLLAHSEVEEAVFYADLSGVKEIDGRVQDALHEHRLVSRFLEDLDATAVTGDTWMTKFLLMKEMLEHHMEGEEAELLTRAQHMFGACETPAAARAGPHHADAVAAILRPRVAAHRA